MKRPSHDLFRLIHAMSRSEKRYFTLFASMGGGTEKGYLRLFDAIAKQKEYDESSIVRQFANESFARNLSYTKNYLYNLILKSLRLYHGEDSAMTQVKGMLVDVELLHHKQLFDQAWKIVARAKELARTHNDFPALLEVVAWENRLRRSTADLDAIEEYVNNGHGKVKTLLAEYSNLLEYGALSQRLFLLIRRDTSGRGSRQREEIDTLSHHPLLLDESSALTFEAKAHFHDLKGRLAHLRGDLVAETRHSADLLALLRAHPERIARAPLNYIAALTNHADLCNALDREDEMVQVLEAMRRTPEEFEGISADLRETLRARVAERADNLQLTRYLATGEFESGRVLAPEMEERLNSLGERMMPSRRNDSYFNLALLWFGLGDHRRALDWINRLINENHREFQEDVHAFARLFSLIVYLELKDFDLLESAIRSVRLYLRKRDRLHHFEEVLLLFLRRIQSVADRDEEKATYQWLLDSIIPLEDDPVESKVFQFFDVHSWLISKLNGKTFAEVVAARRDSMK